MAVDKDTEFNRTLRKHARLMASIVGEVTACPLVLLALRLAVEKEYFDDLPRGTSGSELSARYSQFVLESRAPCLYEILNAMEWYPIAFTAEELVDFVMGTNNARLSMACMRDLDLVAHMASAWGSNHVTLNDTERENLFRIADSIGSALRFMKFYDNFPDLEKRT